MKALRKTIPEIVMKISSQTLRDSLLLFIKLTIVYIFSRFLNKNVSLSLNLIFSGLKAKVRISSLDDIEAMYEIFVLEQYFPKYSLQAQPVIVDLGANIGISTIYFALVYPDSRILAVEPNEEVFKILKENTKNVKNIETYNLAISEITGQQDFFISKKRSHSSSILDRGENFEKKVVTTKKLNDFCREVNLIYIDLLKFDIEGAEFMIRNHFLPGGVKQFVGEMHFDLFDSQLKRDEIFEGYSVDYSDTTSRPIVYGKQLDSV